MSTCLAMSGTLAAIFSFEGSKKWIIREGRKGTSSTGSGAPMASGWAKVRGFLKSAPGIGRFGGLGRYRSFGPRLRPGGA